MYYHVSHCNYILYGRVSNYSFFFSPKKSFSPSVQKSPSVLGVHQTPGGLNRVTDESVAVESTPGGYVDRAAV